MGNFINTNYNKTIDNLVEGAKSRLNNPFYIYGDIKPEKEIKEDKRKNDNINKIIDKITNKICNFKTIILFIVLIVYICSIVTIFSSDRSIGLKAFGSVIDTYLIFLSYMAIHMF